MSQARSAKASMSTAANTTASTVEHLYSTIVGQAPTPESIAEFVAAAITSVRSGSRNAVSIANSTHRAARRTASVTGSAPRLQSPSLNTEQVESSLRYVGFVKPAPYKMAPGTTFVPFTLDDPEAVAEEVGQAAARRVIQDGMNAAASAARADRRAMGWARVTQGADACYFCSMLESRGTVYSSDSFRQADSRFVENMMPPTVLSGELVAKTHDYCRCILVPVFSRGSGVQKNADALYQTWKQVQRQYRPYARRMGWDMIKVWRHYWDGTIDEALRRAGVV